MISIGLHEVGSSDITIVDTHVHCWDALSVRHPWLDERPDLPRRAFLPSSTAIRRARVSGMVIVEAGADPRDAEAEHQAVLRLLGDDAPILGMVSPAEFDGAPPHPFALTSVIGTRITLGPENGPGPSARFAKAVRAAAQHQRAVEVLAPASALSWIAAAVNGGLTTPLVVDHLGAPPTARGWGDPRMSDWRDAMRQLASVPEVVIKLSGVRPGPVVRDAIRWVVDLFGTARCMLGSDWPVTESEHYGAWFAHVAEFLGGLDPDLRQNTAVRTYGPF